MLVVPAPSTPIQLGVIKATQQHRASYSAAPRFCSTPMASDTSFGFLAKQPYDPPAWATHLSPLPSHTFSLAHLPTPIHKWNLPNLPPNTEVWLKRDDLSGMQLSGNKVRKLEFLMADAVAQGADCIITIGGIQSNHCRATAVAAKYLNLDSFLILRTSKALLDKDPGLTGNLLVERLVGAHVELVSKEEYAKIGSVALTNVLKERLISEGRKPYVIPVGGSNSLGTWFLWKKMSLVYIVTVQKVIVSAIFVLGYIEAIREIEQQLHNVAESRSFDDIVVACGSGGTIAGLSLGAWLSNLKAKVHAFSVCDDPDYFYNFAQGLLDGLKARISSRDIVNIYNAKGLGYAINTQVELNFVKEIASATGVVLDPVYSGKAAFGLMKDITENPEKWQGRRILFIHTGGLLGLFDKTRELAAMVGNWKQMELHESVPRQEGVGKMF
uniref:D-cysteine desulfhydrase n=1 Tax=Chenopodium quinoa TaxID=63459 RepID=A0A803N0U1_CHEQI